MLYGLPSVSDLFSICGLYFSTEDTDKHGFLFRVFCVFCGFLFHTEGHGRSRMDTEGYGGGLTKTKTITFTGGCVVSASGRGCGQELP